MKTKRRSRARKPSSVAAAAAVESVDVALEDSMQINLGKIKKIKNN